MTPEDCASCEQMLGLDWTPSSALVVVGALLGLAWLTWRKVRR